MSIPATPAGPMAEAHALELDAADQLRDFRDRFHVPEGSVYLDGNSLGLLSRDAEGAVLAAPDQGPDRPQGDRVLRAPGAAAVGDRADAGLAQPAPTTVDDPL